MAHFLPADAQIGQAQSNHPLAWRMCAIAFLSYNLTLGCMYGAFGVLLDAVETKLHVTRDLSSLGFPLAMLGISLTAPFAGVLAERVSIRLLMMLGALMNCAGYLVLAFSPSIFPDLFAYAVLIGPGLCFTASIIPSALVTRWYSVNRGRALGLASSTLLLAFIPLIATVVLRRFGLSATYAMMAAAMVALLVPLFFVIDFPSNATSTQTSTDQETGAKTTVAPEISVAQLLKSGRLWFLSLAAAAVTTGASILGAHFVPMVKDWNIDATRAATLLTASSLAGMVGPVVVGWLADRVGGAGALALLCIVSAIMWSIMLLQPPFIALIPVVGLLGLLGAAVVPAFGMALSQQYGAATFGRAYGLGFLLQLPFNLLGVPIAARVYMGTHSYALAVMGLVAFFVLGALFAASARMIKPAPATV
jgi:MFS family permease